MLDRRRQKAECGSDTAAESQRFVLCSVARHTVRFRAWRGPSKKFWSTVRLERSVTKLYLTHWLFDCALLALQGSNMLSNDAAREHYATFSTRYRQAPHPNNSMLQPLHTLKHKYTYASIFSAECTAVRGRTRIQLYWRCATVAERSKEFPCMSPTLRTV